MPAAEPCAPPAFCLHRVFRGYHRDAFPHADVASESFGCLLASCVTQRQLLQNEVGGDAAGFLSAAGQMKKQSLGLERVRRVGGWPGVLAKRYRSEAAWNGHRVRIGCVVDTSAAIIPPQSDCSSRSHTVKHNLCQLFCFLSPSSRLLLFGTYCFVAAMMHYPALYKTKYLTGIMLGLTHQQCGFACMSVLTVIRQEMSWAAVGETFRRRFQLDSRT